MLKVISDGKDYEIPEVSEADAEKYDVLGAAEGMDENHCLYLGAKNEKNFFDRVVGYRKTAPEHNETAIRVVFYARKGDEAK